MTAKRPAPRTAFKPGQSGNPSGRPKIPGDVVELARTHTREAISTLAAIMSNAEAPPASKIAAAAVLLDRGWGKPSQTVDLNHRIEPRHLTDAELITLAATGIATSDAGDPEPSLH